MFKKKNIYYRCQNVSLIFTATKRQSVRLLGRKERCDFVVVCFCFLTVSECFIDIHCTIGGRRKVNPFGDSDRKKKKRKKCLFVCCCC